MASLPADDKFRLREERTEQLLQALAVERRPGQCSRLRDEIVLLNMPVAESVAARYRQRGIDFDDLVQVARLGLVEAVRRFDFARGRCFLSFAVPTISGEVKRYFRDHSRQVRPTRRLQELRQAIFSCEPGLAQRLGRPPTTSELAQQLGVTLDDVVQGLASEAMQPLSLDAPIAPGATKSVGDTVGATDERLDAVENHTVLGPVLASLSDDERWLLVCRFEKQLSQQEIADDAGVSQMQISRRLAALLAVLRKRMNDVGVSAAF